MTKEQEKEIYDEKILFIEKINESLKVLKYCSIENVKLDIFEHKVYGTQEYLVITFKGGAISVRNCCGNSSLANLEEFTKMQFGGYYCEVERYKELKEGKD